MEDSHGLNTDVGSLHPGTFVHRQLECQEGGTANSRPRFCGKKIGRNGGRARKGVGDVGKDRIGRNVGPVWRLSFCQDLQGVAFIKERAGSETCPHHMVLGADLGSGTAS